MTSTSAAAVALLAALALLSPGVVDAWGGLFNRFSPEILSNLGYGGRAGPYKPQPFLQVTNCAHRVLYLEFPAAAAAAAARVNEWGLQRGERPLTTNLRKRRLVGKGFGAIIWQLGCSFLPNIRR